MGQDQEMVSLFRAELELCKIKPDETLAVLTEGNDRDEVAQAFLAAARQIGADAFQVNVSKQGAGGIDNVGQNSLAADRGAIESLKRADIVIDLMFLLFSAEQVEITDSGTRMLLVMEPLDILKRLFPTEEQRRRVEAGEQRLARAKEMRITSGAGTDVTYRLGKYPVLTEYGYTDTPGRWDHWPSAFLCTSAYDDGVDGVVVIDKGDIITQPFLDYMRDPITLTIKNGYITGIDGDGVDAQRVRDYIASWNDPDAYAVSHIGWGLNELARWNYLRKSEPVMRGFGMDARSYYGNVLFSTGPNVELGGTNNTPCHLDIPLKGCTLWLDGELIVEEGNIVPDDMCVAGAMAQGVN